MFWPPVRGDERDPPAVRRHRRRDRTAHRPAARVPCRMVGKVSGLTIEHAIGEADDSGDQQSRSNRRICQHAPCTGRSFRRTADGALGRCAIHFSSSCRSCAVCQRSSGSFARHLFTTRSSTGGVRGCSIDIGARLAIQNRRNDTRPIRSLERPFACQHLVDDGAEAEDVTAVSASFP